MEKRNELLEVIEKDCRYYELCREKNNNYVPCYRWRKKNENFNKLKCNHFEEWLLVDEPWIGQGI